ncbi:MAG: preprotein translocase subunit SecY, partial [Deltaproteobacteria bacterium]
MMNAFGNIFKIPELRKRILVTLALLAVYRVGCYIPTPGIDREALASFFQQAGGILGFFNMFAGGAMKRFSVFALGIMPYISAAIILQLLTVVVPHLERLQKEGELGRRKINQYTRYGTVLLCFIQGFGIAIGLEGMRGAAGEMIVLHPGWGFRLTTMITLAAGTTFLMWLGEQITERGIGNGISLIIFAGIVANMPQAAMNTFRLMRAGEINLFFSLF